MERLEEGSHLFLAEGRYYSTLPKGFIGNLSGGLMHTALVTAEKAEAVTDVWHNATI